MSFYDDVDRAANHSLAVQQFAQGPHRVEVNVKAVMFFSAGFLLSGCVVS